MVCSNCTTPAQVLFWGRIQQKEWVTITDNTLGAFENLKKAFLDAPVLAFADYNKPLLLETDASMLGLGAELSQKQTDNCYHLVAYASWSLNVCEHTYHWTKQEFLALKWALVEQFREYLLWNPFTGKTDNNLLTYIMTMPNLDANWYHWVESFAGFTFSIEYHRGQDNTAIDALGQVTLKLDTEIVKSILDRVTVGTLGRVDAHDKAVVEADEQIHKQVWETAVQAWVATQQEDPILKMVIEWICNQKVQELKHLLDQHEHRGGKSYPSRVEKADAPPRSPLPFPNTGLWVGRSVMVHSTHVSLSGCHDECHQDAGHQGQQQTLYLLPNTGPVVVAQHGHADAQSN